MKKTAMLNKKSAFVCAVCIAAALLVCGACVSGKAAPAKPGKSGPSLDNPRLQSALAKLRRGEPVSVVALGGSITTGYQASPPDMSGWAGLVRTWWDTKAKETGSEIIWHNSGASGTDSAYGAIRIQDHALAYEPDVVILEFAINDQWLNPKVRRRSFEGALRQLLDGSGRAVLLLALNQKGDVNAGQRQEQEPIGNHYGLATLAWADWAKSALWNTYFTGSESIHPNNAGHANIAQGITDYLEAVWASLPDDSALTPADPALPAPLVSSEFQHVRLISSDDAGAVLDDYMWDPANAILPGEWLTRGGKQLKGWTTADSDAELQIRVRGKSVGVFIAESDQFRNGEAWIEKPDGSVTPKIQLNTYVSYRSGYYGNAYAEIADNLDPGAPCILHITVKNSPAKADGAVHVIGALCTGVE
ncbi:MAG: SGNH/GDSL hydrolase family protein [Treponema sp.]|jgi:lysophospholipase L1-like esterase|nr:SGNH/GDSL hydrolase family protein [Treponema sp.]